jgi:hypothetical protein
MNKLKIYKLKLYEHNFNRYVLSLFPTITTHGIKVELDD